MTRQIGRVARAAPKPRTILDTLHTVVSDPNIPELSTRQLLILLRLADQGGPDTVRDMAEWCGLNKPAVTRAMDALEHHGMARRVPDREDRRSVFLVLTEEGRTLAGRLG